MTSQPVTKPSKECKLTIDIFQRDGKKLADLCSKCLRLGINCLVEDHPSERDLAGNKINSIPLFNILLIFPYNHIYIYIHLYLYILVGKNDPVMELCRLLNRSTLDEHYIRALSYRATELQLLERGMLSAYQARQLYCKLSYIVTSIAAQAFSIKSGYFFDGLIIPPSCQSKTSLQFILKNGVIFCGKISDTDTITREFGIISLVHKHHSYCPTVIRAIDHLDLGDNKYCLVQPFYPKSMSELGMKSDILPNELILNMAICVLSSIKAFNNVNYCHGDIKPGNIMIDNHSNIMVVIDFGSAVEYNSLIRESSPLYPMDCQEMNITYDLTCLCSSILQLKGIDISEFKTRDELLDKFFNNPNSAVSLAMLCLKYNNVESIISIFLKSNPDFKDYVDMVMPR